MWRRFLPTMPAVRGVIERRLLVNFRLDPDAVQSILPSPFRPKLVGEWAMGGICLIRLRSVRPRGLPAWFGIRSENAAHRFAVEWDDTRGVREGVFVLRRDTDSRLNVWAGGRLFPGVHHRATFEVHETGDDYRVAVRGRDDAVRMLVEGTVADALPAESVFASLPEASRFFERGSCGFSPAGDGRLEGLELRSFTWSVQPLAVRAAESSCFDDERLFPKGAAAFDSALLMRNIEHEWRACRNEPSRPSCE